MNSRIRFQSRNGTGFTNFASAKDIASSFIYNKFNKQDMKIIDDAYKIYKKRFPNSYSDYQGDDSFLSHDDNDGDTSMISSVFNKDMPNHRSSKAHSTKSRTSLLPKKFVCKRNHIHFRKRTSRDMLELNNDNNLSNHSQMGENVQPLQKSQLQNRYPLECHRFNKSIAAQPIREIISKNYLKTVQHTKSVDKGQTSGLCVLKPSCLDRDKKGAENKQNSSEIKENLKDSEELRTEQLTQSSDSNNQITTNSESLGTSLNKWNSLRVRSPRAPKKIISLAKSKMLSNEGAGTNVKLNSKYKDNNLAKNITNNRQTEDTEDIVVNNTSPARSVAQIDKKKQLTSETGSKMNSEIFRNTFLDTDFESDIELDIFQTKFPGPSRIDKDNNLAKNITNNRQTEDTEVIVVNSTSPARSVAQIDKNKQLNSETGSKMNSKIFRNTFLDTDYESDIEFDLFKTKFPEPSRIDKDNNLAKNITNNRQTEDTEVIVVNSTSPARSVAQIDKNKQLNSETGSKMNSKIFRNTFLDTDFESDIELDIFQTKFPGPSRIDKDNNLAKNITNNRQTEDTEVIVVNSTSPARSVAQIDKNKQLNSETGSKMNSKIFRNTFLDTDYESDIEFDLFKTKFPEPSRIDKDNNLAKNITNNRQTEDTEVIVVNSTSPARSVAQIDKNKQLDSETENLKDSEELRTEQLTQSSDSNNQITTNSESLGTSLNKWNSLRVRSPRAPKKIISLAKSKMLSNEGAGTNVKLNSKYKDNNLAKNITNNRQTEDTEDIVVNNTSPARSVAQIDKKKQLNSETENLKDSEELRTVQLTQSSDSNNQITTNSESLGTSLNKWNSLRVRSPRAPKKIISLAKSKMLSNEGAGTNVKLNSKYKDNNLAKNITNNRQTEDTEDIVVNNTSPARSVAQIDKKKQLNSETENLKDSEELRTVQLTQSSDSNNQITTNSESLGTSLNKWNSLRVRSPRAPKKIISLAKSKMLSNEGAGTNVKLNSKYKDNNLAKNITNNRQTEDTEDIVVNNTSPARSVAQIDKKKQLNSETENLKDSEELRTVQLTQSSDSNNQITTNSESLGTSLNKWNSLRVRSPRAPKKIISLAKSKMLSNEGAGTNVKLNSKYKDNNLAKNITNNRQTEDTEDIVVNNTSPARSVAQIDKKKQLNSETENLKDSEELRTVQLTQSSDSNNQITTNSESLGTSLNKWNSLRVRSPRAPKKIISLAKSKMLSNEGAGTNVKLNSKYKDNNLAKNITNNRQTEDTEDIVVNNTSPARSVAQIDKKKQLNSETENLKDSEELRTVQLTQSSDSNNQITTNSESLGTSLNKWNSLRVRSPRAPKKIISLAKSKMLSNEGAGTNVKLNSKYKDNNLAKNITNNRQTEDTEDIVVNNTSPARSVAQIDKKKQLNSETENLKDSEELRTVQLTQSSDSNNQITTNSESLGTSLNKWNSLRVRSPRAPKKIISLAKSKMLSNEGAGTNVKLNSKYKDNNLAKNITNNRQTEDTEDIVVNNTSPARSVAQIDKKKQLNSETENLKDSEELRTEQLTQSSDSNNQITTNSESFSAPNNRLNSLRIRPHRVAKKIISCAESKMLSNEDAGTNVKLNPKYKDNNLAKNITNNRQTEDTEDIVVNSTSPARSVAQIDKNKQLNSETENLKDSEELRTEQLTQSSDSNNQITTNSESFSAPNNRLNSLRIRPHRVAKKIISCAESKMLSNEDAGTNVKLNPKYKDNNLAKNITNNRQTEDTEDIVVNSTSPARSVAQIDKNKQSGGKTGKLTKTTTAANKTNKDTKSNESDTSHSMQQSLSNNETKTKKGQIKRNKVDNKLVDDSNISSPLNTFLRTRSKTRARAEIKKH